jgi:cardiolipin synthase
MTKSLTLAARRGVDVRIITPRIPDKKIVFKVTRSYYAVLAHAGVRIYEYVPGFIHAKTFVSDDDSAVVGTVNMDFRSLNIHFEDGILFMKGSLPQKVRTDFLSTMEKSEEVTGVYLRRSTALRVTQCILRLFSPLF